MQGEELFHTIRPKSKMLNKYIAYYYFHKTFGEDFKRTFTYYPNQRIALNTFQGSKIEWDEERRYTLPADDLTLDSILTFTYKKNREVVMQGPINKVGIIFEPLGLNRFINGSLDNYVRGTITRFDSFDPAYVSCLQDVFREDKVTTKRDLLDSYFLSIKQEFQEELVIYCVQKLLESGGTTALNELSAETKKHRKTILRAFKKHVGCSVREFSRLVKFRNAVETFKGHEGELKLTELAYDSKYYDQSNFNKHIHSISGINPRKLFIELDDMAHENTIWTYKK